MTVGLDAVSYEVNETAGSISVCLRAYSAGVNALLRSVSVTMSAVSSSADDAEGIVDCISRH